MRLFIAMCLLAAFVAGVVLAQTGSGPVVTIHPGQQPPGTVEFSGPTTQKIIPSPVWVPDPSAGHYDCPDGWAAYTRSEPEVYSPGRVVPANLSYSPPRLDKKGHVLQNQPSPAICIQEKP